MDAGVPIKAPVAGIAMGLVYHEGRYVTLTDILGAEDAFGGTQKTVFFGNRNQHFELHEFHSGLPCFGSP